MRGSAPGDVASFQSFQRRHTPLRRSRKLLGRNSPTTNINATAPINDTSTLSRTGVPRLMERYIARRSQLGVAGAYQLDHIVPLSTCWEYKVPEEKASDIRNLQVIPWLLNL